jgi:hypothetical protein
MPGPLNALILLACATLSPQDVGHDSSQPQDMKRYTVKIKAVPEEARTFYVTAKIYTKLKEDRKLDADECWTELPEGKVDLYTGRYAFRAKWGETSRTVGPMIIEDDTTVSIRKDADQNK